MRGPKKGVNILWVTEKQGSKFYVAKAGRVKILWKLKYGGQNSIFYSWNPWSKFYVPWKGGSKFYIFSQCLEKGGSKPRSLPTNFTEGVPPTPYQLHWRGPPPPPDCCCRLCVRISGKFIMKGVPHALELTLACYALCDRAPPEMHPLKMFEIRGHLHFKQLHEHKMLMNATNTPDGLDLSSVQVWAITPACRFTI